MRLYFTMVLVALTAVGCYKSELKNKGELTLEISLPSLPDYPSGADISENFSAIISGEQYDVDGSTLALGEVESGEYSLYVYNNATSITMDGFTAKIASSGGVAEDQIGVLFFGKQLVTVTAADIISSDLTLEPIVRPLAIDIQVLKGDAERITSIEASLTGIASEWDCLEDKPQGDILRIEPTIVEGAPQIRAEVEGRYSCIAYLLGVLGNEQTLTLSITFNDGKQQTIEMNASEELKEFNHNKGSTFTLVCELYVPDNAGVSGTVIDWELKHGGEITVN